MAAPRPSALLPAITCSKCNDEIEISLMGEHRCTAKDGASQPLGGFLGRLAMGKPKPAESGPMVRRNSGKTPAPIDPNAANRPFGSKANNKPTNIPAFFSSFNNMKNSKERHSRNHSKSLLSGSAARPRSPDRASNLECAFPPFPSPLEGSKPKPKAGNGPTYTAGMNSTKADISVIAPFLNLGPSPATSRPQQAPPPSTLQPLQPMPSHNSQPSPYLQSSNPFTSTPPSRSQTQTPPSQSQADIPPSNTYSLTPSSQTQTQTPPRSQTPLERFQKMQKITPGPFGAKPAADRHGGGLGPALLQRTQTTRDSEYTSYPSEACTPTAASGPTTLTRPFDRRRSSSFSKSEAKIYQHQQQQQQQQQQMSTKKAHDSAIQPDIDGDGPARTDTIDAFLDKLKKQSSPTHNRSNNTSPRSAKFFRDRAPDSQPADGERRLKPPSPTRKIGFLTPQRHGDPAMPATTPGKVAAARPHNAPAVPMLTLPSTQYREPAAAGRSTNNPLNFSDSSSSEGSVFSSDRDRSFTSSPATTAGSGWSHRGSMSSDSGDKAANAKKATAAVATTTTTTTTTAATTETDPALVQSGGALHAMLNSFSFDQSNKTKAEKEAFQPLPARTYVPQASTSPQHSRSQVPGSETRRFEANASERTPPWGRALQAAPVSRPTDNLPDPAIQLGLLRRPTISQQGPTTPPLPPTGAEARTFFNDAQSPMISTPPRAANTAGGGSKGNCRGCGLVIIGKSLRAADGRLTGRYHRECFRCKTCAVAFTSTSFYVLANQPYCERHYHELNGSLCAVCDGGIEGTYLATSAVLGPSSVSSGQDSKYHPACFCCSDCAAPLNGDYFDVDGRECCEECAYRRSEAEAGPPSVPALEPEPELAPEAEVDYFATYYADVAVNPYGDAVSTALSPLAPPVPPKWKAQPSPPPAGWKERGIAGPAAGLDGTTAMPLSAAERWGSRSQSRNGRAGPAGQGAVGGSVNGRRHMERRTTQLMLI